MFCTTASTQNNIVYEKEPEIFLVFLLLFCELSSAISIFKQDLEVGARYNDLQ